MRRPGLMFQVEAPARVWLSQQPTDMGKRCDGPVELVRRALGEEPLGGEVFDAPLRSDRRPRRDP